MTSLQVPALPLRTSTLSEAPWAEVRAAQPGASSSRVLFAAAVPLLAAIVAWGGGGLHQGAGAAGLDGSGAACQRLVLGFSDHWAR